MNPVGCLAVVTILVAIVVLGRLIAPGPAAIVHMFAYQAPGRVLGLQEDDDFEWRWSGDASTPERESQSLEDMPDDPHDGDDASAALVRLHPQVRPLSGPRAVR